MDTEKGIDGMTALLWQRLLCAALVGLPSLAWAQGYEMLTLAEAAYLYSGLEVQEILRNSSLRHLPQVIMVCCTIWLVYRRVTSARPQPIAGIVAYIVSCGLILVLFWPEASPRFLTVRTLVPSGGVTSYIAVRNGMTNVNARSSGLVPRQLLSGGTAGTQVPQALHLILGAITEMPLLLGEAIYPGLNRAFGRVPVIQDFVDQVETNPPASLRTRMPDFVDQCYRPALESLLKDDAEPTFEKRMPWSSDMSGHLSDITIQGKRGISDDFATGPTPTPTTCQAFYQDMEEETLQYLRSQRTAQGSNKARVARVNMGINGREQARIFVMREMERQMETVQGPNRVVNAKRALDVTSGVAGALSQFDITAPFKSMGSQLEKHLDRMSRFLGIGSFLVYWGPYLVGIAIFVTLSLFPVVLLWSMFPGQHFKPLVNYFLLLIFVCSTPLWWALVDGAAEVAYAQHPPVGWFAAPAGWGLAYTSYMVVTVVGIILVPVLQATLLFGTWRAIGGIWHG